MWLLMSTGIDSSTRVQRTLLIIPMLYRLHPVEERYIFVFEDATGFFKNHWPEHMFLSIYLMHFPCLFQI